jgi:hypothetical protein
MAISDQLRALNVELAARESAGDEQWFQALLAPQFTMRRANGDLVDRGEFLKAVAPSAERRTQVVTGTELEVTAVVSCQVSMEQEDGSSKSFHNHRLFVRADTEAEWQLLGWANEPAGAQVSITGQVALEFTGDPETLKKLQNLSAIYCDGGRLWVACDELAELELLTLGTGVHGEKRYHDHQAFPLTSLGVSLPDGDEEVDAEGIDLADGYLWLVGSHSRTRSRLKAGDDEDDLEKFARARERPNRHVLLRIALEEDGDGVRPVNETTGSVKRRTAALIGDLTTALRDDPYLGPSLAVPAKENGLDVEGLAVLGDRVLLGLRGPVLRSWATVLEVEPQPDPEDPSRLRLGSPPYRRHFLDLDDLGVRDLCRDGNDVLVLAGPSMGLDGPVRVYRWHDAADAKDRDIVAGDDLTAVAPLPFGEGDDHAEGITVISPPGEPVHLLVVYDSPADARLTDADGKLSILADLTSPLPQ